MSTKISIITLSTRPNGLKIVEKAIRQQTIGTSNVEWIIGSPFKPDVGVKYRWAKDPPKPKELYWQVYRQYNTCLRKAKGELVVSWQDFTYTSPDTLQRLWDHYEEEPKSLIGAVGNKYSDDSFLVETWHDPRIRDKGYYDCPYNEIEWNLCSVPKESLYKVGGFDEYLDRYSSLCGLDVLDRLNILGGYKFKIDESIRSFSTEHPRLPKWEENSPLNGIYEEYRKKYLSNPVLNYLT